ncbi:MAG: hypothetical protein KKG79_07540 [Acidobacteria bacterium]|nr:hypothetical protein [Acidobacteriota bacterium]
MRFKHVFRGILFLFSIFFLFSVVQVEGNPLLGSVGNLPNLSKITCKKINETAKPIAQNQLLAAQTSFIGFFRYPVEDKVWIQVFDHTGYYRDLSFMGGIMILNVEEGDFWNTSLLCPSGITLNWGQVTFSDNCFRNPDWEPNCGSSNILIYYPLGVQCIDSGTYTMNFYKNEIFLFSKAFIIEPRIAPFKLTPYDQRDYPDHYDNRCRAVLNGVVNYYNCDLLNFMLLMNLLPSDLQYENATIAQRGCALTSAAMLLKYHGVNVDPQTLNQWLSQRITDWEMRGYDLDGNVRWPEVVEFALQQNVNISYLGRDLRSPFNPSLETTICKWGPQILGVKNDNHFVMASGEDNPRTTIEIIDPSGGVRTNIRDKYNGEISSVRYFMGPEVDQPAENSYIYISFHSPGELVLTDPLGRKTGRDPLSGTDYEEIPNSSYGKEYEHDDETGETVGEDFKTLEIVQPLAGNYKLQIIGTGFGTYNLEICGRATSGGFPSVTNFTLVPISPNNVHIYGFKYQLTPSSEIQFNALEGNFDGKGQRPSDVNKFISYVTPTQSRTTLPAGEKMYGLVLIYDKAIIPATFAAILNGRDIKDLFKPQPGQAEAVWLMLDPGSNTLVISVDGNLENRAATDTDRLVFIVQ